MESDLLIPKFDLAPANHFIKKKPPRTLPGPVCGLGERCRAGGFRQGVAAFGRFLSSARPNWGETGVFGGF